MIRLEAINYLWLLLLLPILVGIYLFFQWENKKNTQKLIDTSLQKQLAPDVSTYKPKVKLILQLLALLFLICSLTNLQMGESQVKINRKSIDIFLCLDVSKSMEANDTRPSRMAKSKLFADKLVDNLRGDRIGTIVFAGNAFLQMPVTADYSASKIFIRTTKTDQVPTQGTAIGDAIELAMNSFNKENTHHKAIVIISDGENHEGSAESMAQKAKDEGAFVYTIGVGEIGGSLIPFNNNGQLDYIKDEGGNPVRSKLNEEMMRNIANNGGGNYFKLNNIESVIKGLKSELAKIEKRDMEDRMYGEYNSFFQYFILATILMLFIDYLLSDNKFTWLRGKDLFKI